MEWASPSPSLSDQKPNQAFCSVYPERQAQGSQVFAICLCSLVAEENTSNELEQLDVLFLCNFKRLNYNLEEGSNSASVMQLLFTPLWAPKSPAEMQRVGRRNGHRWAETQDVLGSWKFPPCLLQVTDDNCLLHSSAFPENITTALYILYIVMPSFIKKKSGFSSTLYNLKYHNLYLGSSFAIQIILYCHIFLGAYIFMYVQIYAYIFLFSKLLLFFNYHS